MNKALVAFSLIAASTSCGIHVQASSSPLSPVQFLVGDWIGGGDTDAGQTTGRSVIKPDLDERVLVRRDHTDFPATPGHPASSMDALMLICPQASDGQLHATYMDSGGHVIQYTAARVVPDRLVEFDSDPSPSAPTFRLTYTVSAAKTLEIRFEMAAPSSPAVFHPVAAGTLKRIGSK